MDTVLGVKWNIASGFEILVVIIVIIILAFIFILLKYMQVKKDRQIHNEQLFLFKMKRIGLSNFQIKIMSNMVSIIHLKNATDILEDKKLFHKAVGKFLHYLRDHEESEKNLESICHDIVIIYEKCYSSTMYKKPLTSPINIESQQLLYFISDQNVYLGLIKDVKKESIVLELFRNPQELKDLKTESMAQVYIWRMGDAQYNFSSKIKDCEGQMAILTLPNEIQRGHELRHPYVNVIIPAAIKLAHPKATEDNPAITATIFKLNDYEIIFRVNTELDYNKEILLIFKFYDVEMSIECKIIADHTIHDEKIIYYTVKFLSITDIQLKIIKQYMSEHL